MHFVPQNAYLARYDNERPEKDRENDHTGRLKTREKTMEDHIKMIEDHKSSCEDGLKTIKDRTRMKDRPSIILKRQLKLITERTKK